MAASAALIFISTGLRHPHAGIGPMPGAPTPNAEALIVAGFGLFLVALGRRRRPS